MLKKTLVLLLILTILSSIGFLIWIQNNRFSPEEISPIKNENPQNQLLNYGDSLGILLWNISYGGMPAQMDFFYSGGTKIRLGEKETQHNFQSILTNLQELADSTDVFLLHKVDTASKRSYHIQEYKEIQKILPHYETAFCLNFSNPYIPVPLDKPIGPLYSGMLNLSKYHAQFYQRISLNNKEYSWPKRLFTAQKCVSLASYPIGSKQFVILNVHLNSYDYQGEIRLAQLAQIEKLADSLYQKGNYVLVAGGWNMSPPGFKKYRISYGYKGKPAYPEIDSSTFFNRWKFEYDPKIPTSRSLKEAYRHGAINTSIKDFFICSPNMSILNTKTLDQKFQFSDHQAIYLRVLLLPGSLSSL